MRVLLVAPVPPPYGGMALQARQLDQLLRHDGVDVDVLASNFNLPSSLNAAEQVPGVRTCLRAVLIWFMLWPRIGRADVVHVMAASWLYFFLTVYPAVLVGRVRGKRVVINYRGGEAREFFERYGWMASPAFTLARTITAPSEFLASAIRERFGVTVSIVPNILDSSRFVYRARTAIRPTLLVTRHLEKMYDIETVLEAAHLRLKHNRIQRGTAPDEDRLQIRLRRAPRPSVLSMAEQLRSLPGVREVRHTGG